MTRSNLPFMDARHLDNGLIDLKLFRRVIETNVSSGIMDELSTRATRQRYIYILSRKSWWSHGLHPRAACIKFMDIFYILYISKQFYTHIHICCIYIVEKDTYTHVYIHIEMHIYMYGWWWRRLRRKRIACASLAALWIYQSRLRMFAQCKIHCRYVFKCERLFVYVCATAKRDFIFCFTYPLSPKSATSDEYVCGYIEVKKNRFFHRFAYFWVLQITSWLMGWVVNVGYLFECVYMWVYIYLKLWNRFWCLRWGDDNIDFEYFTVKITIYL